MRHKKIVVTCTFVQDDNTIIYINLYKYHSLIVRNARINFLTVKKVEVYPSVE